MHKSSNRCDTASRHLIRAFDLAVAAKHQPVEFIADSIEADVIKALSNACRALGLKAIAYEEYGALLDAQTKLERVA
jgi:hypothetical protein